MMAAPAVCHCPCHSTAMGNAYAVLHRGDVQRAEEFVSRPDFADVEVNTGDALEAAVATGCSCLRNHIPALGIELKEPKRYELPSEWVPDTDDDSDATGAA